VIDGLVQIGKRLGVEYYMSTSVRNIQLSTDEGKATGVVLADGTTISADIIICNADLVYAYNNLLPQSRYGRSLSSRPASCSSISFYWGLSRRVPELEAHNVFLADAYRESFDSIFKEQFIPAQPSFYVNVPSRVDTTAAPAGKETVVVLVPVGHLVNSDSAEHRGTPMKAGTTQDWPSIVSFARNRVLRTILERTGVDLEPLIVTESLNTPLSWKHTFNLDKGAILGLSHSFFNVLSFRPKTKHASIKGLYFVGASTHPGTGVPIVLAGSKIVAEQVCNDHGFRVPWRPGGLEVKTTGRNIDKAQPRPALGWLETLLFFIVGFTASIFAYLFNSKSGSQFTSWRFVGDW
jgi:phytoene desaturase (3,4-didehydrolycopene-forming)